MPFPAANWLLKVSASLCTHRSLPRHKSPNYFFPCRGFNFNLTTSFLPWLEHKALLCDAAQWVGSVVPVEEERGREGWRDRRKDGGMEGGREKGMGGRMEGLRDGRRDEEMEGRIEMEGRMNGKRRGWKEGEVEGGMENWR